MNTTPKAQPDAQVCLERLVELARQKHAVLKERRHADLSAIVAAEEAALADLEQLRSEPSNLQDEVANAANQGQNNPQSFAQVAAAVAELQQLNSTNAALLQEHLTVVDTCLEILEHVASPTYSPNGGKEDKVIRRVLDVRA